MQEKFQNAPLRLPALPLEILPGPLPDETELLEVIPVFEDHSVDEWVEAVDGRGEDALRQAKERQIFRAQNGEVLTLVAEGLHLVGLGKSAAFHPETAAAVFRDLGGRIAGLSQIGVVVHLPKAFAAALDSYSNLRRLPPGGVDRKKEDATPVKPKGAGPAVRKGTAASSAAAAYPEGSPDYVFATGLVDMCMQLTACLQVGADPMDLLTAERASRSVHRGPVFWKVYAMGANEIRAAVEQGNLQGRMVNGSRYIASMPGNQFHPAGAEQYARSLAEEFGLEIEVFDHERLAELGCDGILSVGKGSEIPPRMIRMSYSPTEEAGGGHVALVGKGVTFDTGGISIKPGEMMHEMKFDMCGAAVAMHSIALAAARKLPLRVSTYVGFAENMPDGKALKPGDVYTAYNGVTVEIQNTDAEGRLILGDVLSYAAKDASPDLMLDFATLTGACIIALGHEAAGLMTPSEDLAEQISKAGLSSLDRVWRMPHWSAYDPALKSDTADMRNIGGRPAGSITAMRFLAKFVPPGLPWAHIDIAGTAWRDKPRGSQPKGATGWGVRMLDRFFDNLLR